MLNDKIWRSLAIAFVFCLSVRLALLACIVPALRVNEFADDALYYRVLIKDPTMLVTGRIAPAMEGGVIYAPLMPFGISFPGRWLAQIFGFSVGHRLAMIFYDTSAVTLALGLAWRITSPPKNFKEWVLALCLCAIPGSALASAVWGQEDTLSAVWAALCLLALTTRRPVRAAVIAGFGVFTIKLFAVLLVLGIWLGSPGSRRKIAVAGAVPALLFVSFICIRWYFSGLSVPSPTYNGVSNSPSIYSAFYYLVRPVTFQQVQPLCLLTTALGLGALIRLAFRAAPTPATAILSVHAMFFLTFIGIQPEHHQWFMPFLIYVAWSSCKAGGIALPLAGWLFSFFAYGYKIAFGLQGKVSASSAGKDVFRSWFAGHVQANLFPIQMLMLFLTLATGAVVCVLAFRFGIRERLRSDFLPVEDRQLELPVEKTAETIRTA